MKKILLIVVVALAGCGGINHADDGEAATEACKQYGGLWWWQSTSPRVRADHTWRLDVTCRDGTEISIPRGRR